MTFMRPVHRQADYSLRADWNPNGAHAISDDRAAAFATGCNATLAVDRSQALPGQVSLSPHSVRTATSLERLILPSPNGSTITFQLADAVPEVIAVSLRNRHAAAQWLLARRALRPELRVAVIAAGNAGQTEVFDRQSKINAVRAVFSTSR
jgi:phosphosulfolactate phosphohydrolase-like enzyme